MAPAWGGGDSPNPQNGQCYYVQHGNHLEPALKILGCTCGHEMMDVTSDLKLLVEGMKGVRIYTEIDDNSGKPCQFLLYDFLQVFFFLRAFVLKHSPSVVLGVSHLVKPSC